MTLSNTSLVPEFQHYFHDFVLNSTVNKNQIPMPVDIPEMFLTSGSVVELLCSETFPYDSYTYLYSNLEDLLCWPTLTRQRLMVYPSSKYLVPGTEGDNIFNLQADDFLMLDVLFQYRQDATSVTIIDTTADIMNVTIDTTAGFAIVEGNVNGLNTPLSQLIFLYLDLHINARYNQYAWFDSAISDCTMLATCFELKLIDDYFDFFTNMGVSFGIDCPEGYEDIGGPP
jgi:hypothetical protein